VNGRNGDIEIPVAVCDPVPAYRHGVIAALAKAGYDAEAVDDLELWAGRGGRRVLLLSLDLSEDAATMRSLRDLNPEVVVVALLRQPTVRAYQDALRLGATGAVAWDSAEHMVVEVFLAAVMHGCSLLPAGVARALAAATLPPPTTAALSLWESQWLRMLANGATVPELAAATSYSEREMYRLLSRLYAKMGARTRTEAIVRAAQAGLLD
jgi:DNA-binding NarL/FixJ family response regulator